MLSDDSMNPWWQFLVHTLASESTYAEDLDNCFQAADSEWWAIAGNRRLAHQLLIHGDLDCLSNHELMQTLTLLTHGFDVEQDAHRRPVLMASFAQLHWCKERPERLNESYMLGRIVVCALAMDDVIRVPVATGLWHIGSWSAWFAPYARTCAGAVMLSLARSVIDSTREAMRHEAPNEALLNSTTDLTLAGGAPALPFGEAMFQWYPAAANAAEIKSWVAEVLTQVRVPKKKS